MSRMRPRFRGLAFVFGQGLLALGLAPALTAQPIFSKAFSPSTIGPGSASTLTFTITESGGGPVTSLAFTDVLPAGVTLTSPSGAVSTCDGTLSAPDGGGTIQLSGGRVGAFGSCTVRVFVTSSTVGTHMNVSGALTSSAGDSGVASADLTVATNRAGFSKSFAPSAVKLGSRSTLTLSIDNSLNGSISLPFFTDVLPDGLVVADPANVSTDCPGTLTASEGTGTISLSNTTTFLAAGATCSVSVDVVASAATSLVNATELTSQGTSSGRAVAGLTVSADALGLTKAFVGDPVPPGATLELAFTIINRDRSFTATNVSFTDDLDAVLSGLVAVGLPANPCGGGSQLSGTGALTLTGGSLAPGASCTFSVTLQVPAAAANGAFPNTTSAITADVGGSPVVGSAASDTLFVEPAPLLTKEFLGDPVGAGQTVTLRFTITNTSATSTAADLAFLDELTTFLPFPVSATLPAAGFCGGSSSLSLVSLGSFGQGLSMTGGSLGAGASCTFDVDLDVPADVSGVFTNTTGPITATVDAATVTGDPATDDLVVVAAPDLTIEFTDDPVAPGNTATLQFTLRYGAEAPGDATGVSFTDDLNAALSGLVAVNTPLGNLCSGGDDLSGTTSLTYSGGTLTPGQICQFAVTVQVPAGALPGAYANTTSGVSATVLGVPAAGNPGTDSLQVAGLELTKSFVGDPIIAGESVSLEFTLTNTSPGSDATSIAFTDSLGALPGSTFNASLPATPCGASSVLSRLSGNTLLSFTGGSLMAGQSCTFSVTVDVAAGTATGSYPNATSNVSATMEMATVIFDGAADILEVDSDRLSLGKSFIDDPVPPGGAVTLRFTLANLDPTRAATGIAFTDDLSAALSGLATASLPPNGFCGASSQITGGSVVSVTGASLAAAASCSFDVSVAVPMGVPLGAIVTNTTSGVTGTISALNVFGPAASDVLRVSFLDFSKSFDGPTVAGGAPILTFTILNASSTETISGIGFTDDLSTALAGLAATGLPASDVCGTGSSLEGTTSLLFSGGSLAPSTSCDIPVSLQVPAGASPGSYDNVSGELFVSGIPVVGPAMATLIVEPPPGFSKAFVPGTIDVGDTTTLTFTVDNGASSLSATALDFTDNLPAGLEVATTPNASTTCTGGTLTAVAGAGVVSYSGGTVAAAASCTVAVDVTGTAAGDLVNTSGSLTSSSGSSGTASDTLTVNDVTPPRVTAVNSVLDTGDGSLDDCEPTRVAITQLLVTFDEPMNDPAGNGDADDVTNPANYRLVRAGPDGDFATLGCGPAQGDDLAVAVSSVSYDDPSRTATLTVNGGRPLPDDLHRLFACSGLVDAAGGNALDGDGNGTGGDDFSRDFRVDRSNLLVNGNFDCDLVGWQLASGDPAEIVHDGLDADASGVSGSARVTNLTGGTAFGVTQCVDVSDPGATLSGRLRVETTGVVATLLCRRYDAPGCAGTLLGTVGVGSLTADKGGATGVWQAFSGEITLAGARSLSCGAELVSGSGSAFDARVDDVSLVGEPAFRIFRAERSDEEGARDGKRGRAKSAEGAR